MRKDLNTRVIEVKHTSSGDLYQQEGFSGAFFIPHALDGVHNPAVFPAAEKTPIWVKEQMSYV